jgi:hypothetical protein
MAVGWSFRRCSNGIRKREWCHCRVVFQRKPKTCKAVTQATQDVVLILQRIRRRYQLRIYQWILHNIIEFLICENDTQVLENWNKCIPNSGSLEEIYFNILKISVVRNLELVSSYGPLHNHKNKQKNKNFWRSPNYKFLCEHVIFSPFLWPNNIDELQTSVSFVFFDFFLLELGI